MENERGGFECGFIVFGPGWGDGLGYFNMENNMKGIEDLIVKYFSMKDGEFIENHLDYFVVWEDEIEVRIKNKTIKHIVESRKRDGYNIENIISLFERMVTVLNNQSYIVLSNIDNNSYNLIQKDYDNKGLVIALDVNIENDSIHIRTLFFKASTKIKQLLKQKTHIK